MIWNIFKKEKSYWDLYELDIKKYLIEEYNLDKVSDRKIIKDVINNLDFCEFNSACYNLEDYYVVDILTRNSGGGIFSYDSVINWKTFEVMSFYKWKKLKNREEKFKLLLDN